MKTLIVVGETGLSAADRTDEPMKDYQALACALNADITYVNERYPLARVMHRLEKVAKLDVALGWQVARSVNDYDVILSVSEKVGIPLAWAMRLVRKRVTHIMIGHKLSSGLKRPVLTRMNIPQTFSDIICVSAPQRDFCISHLRMPADRVHMIFDKVDHDFFSPCQDPLSQPVQVKGDYILAVGQEQRDYLTLIRALAGLDIQLIVVASSPWSSSQIKLEKANNITQMSRIPYRDLRALYSCARLVALPLHEVDYAAGANGLLEAMAMGKPVIVSDTVGLREYFQHGDVARSVPPADPASLRAAICALWNDEQARTMLGANARRQIEMKMNMYAYVNDVAQVIQHACHRKAIVR